MDNISTQSTKVIDNKTQQLSKKVWRLEGIKDKVINIDSSGRIPLEVTRTLESNKLFITNYVDSSTSKRRYIQKVNGKIEIKDI
jgi:hypothetical protein